MPAVHRLGDADAGHGCFPLRATTAGSPDSFVNGKAVIRVGDPYANHCCGPSCHPAAALTGSTTHFTNGRATVRQGDRVDCFPTNVANQGSPDKSVGG